MALLRGFIVATAVFIGSFALHIVGGASGQGWLFATAVALIFASATGFPVLVALASRGALARNRPASLLSVIVGTALTESALWAANGRGVAWWEAPAALIAVTAVSGFAFVFLGRHRAPMAALSTEH